MKFSLLWIGMFMMSPFPKFCPLDSGLSFSMWHIRFALLRFPSYNGLVSRYGRYMALCYTLIPFMVK